MTVFTDEQIKMLSAKLDMTHVQPPKQFGPKGDYLEGWHVIAEANRIFGFDGWSYEIAETKCVAQVERQIGRDKKDGFGVTYTSKVRVDIDNIRREDFGAGHGYDVDVGLAHESAIKEAVTDALKRTLRSFGNQFGLALYDKARANVETPEEAAKNAAIENLWIELTNIRSLPGLQSFMDDNKRSINGMSKENKDKFISEATRKKTAFLEENAIAATDDSFPGDTK